MTLTSYNWGDRGGRWVAAQLVLMALVLAFAALPPGWGDASILLAALGAALALVGGLLVVWAWRTLDRAATPFPLPRPGGRLVETGPYAFVRHPVYAGGIVFFVGFALASSPAVFVPLAALVVLWRNKAALEEDLLEEKFPDYAEYRERVRGAFVPRSFALVD
jgi:protein-S-isoprenylcysteine O-methyltransferase Ste14